MKGDPAFLRRFMHKRIELGEAFRHIPVDAAEPGIMQAVDELRPDAVDQVHHRLRFRQDVMEMHILVIDREGPVHLRSSQPFPGVSSQERAVLLGHSAIRISRLSCFPVELFVVSREIEGHAARVVHIAVRISSISLTI